MFIPSAFAAPAAGQTDPILGFLPLVVLFGLFYFMILRPQMKNQKLKKTLQDNLAKGDEVVTASGQYGKVVKMSEHHVTLDLGNGVLSHFQRQAVHSVLPKGTMKDL